VSSQCQKSQEKTDNKGLPAEVVETIERRIEEGLTPSITIAIIDSSGVKFFNFGKTAKNGHEVNENTIYEIGSISKVFTGILLAQQVVEGDLKLEDEINNFLPNGIKVQVLGDTEITFGNLTDHTSGFPSMPHNFSPANPHNPYADYTVDQMYEFISNYHPVRTVGSEFEYSNIAQGLLGHLLAMNKGCAYEELMVQTIADPLGMNDTRIELSKRMKKNLALGHNGRRVVENWDIPTLAGAGAIRSSTSDMAKFVSANLGYMSSPLMDAMELSHQVRHDMVGDRLIAMAWHIMKGEKGDMICHGGATGGYRTFIGFVKETGKGVVLLSNSSEGADDIGYYLLDSGSELARFKSDAADIPKSILKQYVGWYKLQSGRKIKISREGKQLFGRATGQDRFGIYPENDTVFYLTVNEAKIIFHLEKDAVTSLTLLQDGHEILGKKIE
ncbi:serine hydrolase, partial [Bacteroidota bacterium]